MMQPMQGARRASEKAPAELLSPEWLELHTGVKTGKKCNCGGVIWGTVDGLTYCGTCSWSNDLTMIEFQEQFLGKRKLN